MPSVGVTAPNGIKVLFVEDHSLVRESYIAAFSARNIEIVGEAENGKEALELLSRGCRPNIIITDIEMPEMNGFALIKNLKLNFPSIKIVVITMHAADYIAAECLAEGAHAVFTKSTNLESIHTVLGQLLNGTYKLDEKVRENVERIQKNISPRTNLNLTEREKQLLPHLCDGKTNRMIGDEFSIGAETVKTHRKSIMQKTSSNSISELVKYAIKRGLVDLFR